MSSRSPRFVEGWVSLIETLGGSRYVWWGQDESEEDVVGTRDGRVAAFAAVDEVAAFIQERGWDGIAHVEVDEDSVLDLRPAQAWVRGLGPLDASSAINLWNFAEDILRSTTGNALTSGRTTNGLHAHLTEVAVPFLARHDQPPPWRAQDLRRLRVVLGRAGEVVEEALGI